MSEREAVQTAAAAERKAPPVDEAYKDAIQRHVTLTVGAYKDVFHEMSTSKGNVDVLVVPPAHNRTWTTLVTCGMGHRQMRLPKGTKRPDRVELAVCLPPKWPPFSSDEHESLRTSAGAWIVTHLQFLAGVPFEYRTWFDVGDVIPNGDPPEPFQPDSKLCGSMFATPRRIGAPQFRKLFLPDGRQVSFLSVYLLTVEEMRYKERHGQEKFMARLKAHKVDEMVRLTRPSACRGGVTEYLFG